MSLLRETALKIIVPLFVENPAQKKSFVQLQANLEQSKTIIEARVSKAASQNLETHRTTLRHIIGIERWGTNRLKVALGQAFKSDGQKEYHPDQSLDLTQLLEHFRNSRLELLGVAKLLEAANSSIKIEHNNFGPISVKGWLGYLNVHSEIESRKLR
jgi:hypothetical protein